MKVLVLGATGMLGCTLVPLLQAHGHQVVSQSRSNLTGFVAADLTNIDETSRLLGGSSADAVINLTGLTDVERCESHPQEAWLANVRIAENIAAASSAAGAHLIHISTDQVYDKAPIASEEDAMPGNHYAMTKYAGELAALAVPATVLRTNFFGASAHPTRRSLTDWLFNALHKGSAVQVFEDVRFSPLSMATLCEMIEQVVQRRPLGIFNLGSHAGLSKADFAFVFAAELGLSSGHLNRSTTDQAGFLKAWRPKEMCMDSSRFEAEFNLVLPRLQDEIQRVTKDYRELIKKPDADQR